MLLGMHFLVDVLAFFLPTAFSQPKTKQTLDILETPVLIRVALQVAKSFVMIVTVRISEIQ